MGQTDRLNMLSDDKRSFTAVALETISGGFVVCATGTADDVVTGSGMSSYAWNDIQVCTGESMADDETATNTAVGIALTTATSGNEIGVVADGIFIVEAEEAGVTPGLPIRYAGSVNLFQDNLDAGSGYQVVGKALTGASAAEGKFFIARLHF